MKKLYILAFLLVFAGVLSAQTFTITPSSTVTESLDPRHSLDVYIHFTNTTQSTQSLRWKGTDATISNGWIVTICDNGSCFSVPHSPTENMVGVVAGDSSFLKGTFTPDNNPGSANIAFWVWDANDSAATATEVRMIVNATTTAITSSELNDLYSVSPSPASDILHLRANTGSLDKGEMKLYDLKGQVVLQKSISATSVTDFDVRNLAPGIYMMRYSTKAGVMTKKVVIAH